MILGLPGSAAQTKTPTGCYVSIFRVAPICPCIAKPSSAPLQGTSTRGRERPCSIKPQLRSSPNVLQRSVEPALGNRTFAVTVDIERQWADTEGCLLSFGDGRSGFALYVLRDRLLFDYNLFGQHLKAVSEKIVPVGKVSVGVLVERLGKVGRASVLIDGKPCGSVDIPFLVRRHSGGNLNIGRDEGIAVSNDYQAPFAFQGSVGQVVIELPAQRDRDAKEAARSDVAIDLARQ